MRVHHFLSLILVLLSMPVSLSASSILTDFDKKIILTDSLNLPSNTSAYTLIGLLPELLQRPGNSLLSNYDIQIEEMSVGYAADVALSNLQIVDVVRIEVSESPVSSYRNNGQGGSINFVLRSSSDAGKPAWGSVGLSLASPLDVAPQFSFGYRSDKLLVRGLLLGELYNVTHDVQTLGYADGAYTGTSSSSRDNHFSTELARAYLQYQMTDCDVLKFDVSEDYSRSKDIRTTDFNTEKATTEVSHATTIQALLNYKHLWKRSSLSFETQYSCNPSDNSFGAPLYYDYLSEISRHTVSGKLEYDARLLDRVSDRGTQQLSLTIGTNYNAAFSKEDASIEDMNFGSHSELNPEIDTYYLMPYLRMQFVSGKFRLKAVGEYQFYRYDIDGMQDPYSVKSNDFTGKLMAEWHFTDRRNLRLILDRKLQRPTYEQLYPYRLYSPKRMEYVEGNPELRPMTTDEVMIDYIQDSSWGNGHSLVFNAGASYNVIRDIIRSKYTGSSDGAGLGLAQRYLYFENHETNRVVSSNLMALYSYRSFALSFTGNLYHRREDKDSGGDHYTYYNLSLYPHFNLRDGWHGGARLTYYSRVGQENASLSDCAVSEMSVGRSWRNLFVYIYQRLSLDHNNKDISRSGLNRTETLYLMTPNVAGIGMKYTF